MVGFDPELKKRLSANEAALAGAMAGSLTRIVTQPFDVLKIRFQLQLENIDKNAKDAKYQGIVQATKRIITEESVTALWKGHSPAQLLSTTYGIYQFASFEFLTKKVYELGPVAVKDYQPVIHFACGGVSGCIATLGSMPFDVIRTRLVAQGIPETYRGTFDAIYVMFKTEGVRTFFRGLTPALIQIYPFTGIQFAAYGFLSRWWKKTSTSEKARDPDSVVGWIGSMACGIVSGATAKTAIYPLDVVKKRLQIQGFEDARKKFGKVGKYTGLINCIQMMVEKEGILSFFKGYIPSCGKSGLATGCNFCFYEQITNALQFVQSEDFWF